MVTSDSTTEPSRTLAQTTVRSPMRESKTWLPARMTASRPMEVLPRRMTAGSMVTSSAISTLASMKVLAGSCSVTPARMWASLMRRRISTSASASWARSLMPSSVPSSSTSSVTTARSSARASGTSSGR